MSLRDEPLPTTLPAAAAAAAGGYPDHPILVRVWRGSAVESVHRGAWCLVDETGTVLDGAGDWDGRFYVRSSIKSIQALPLFETGAAERFAFTPPEIALAVASHAGERCHTEQVAATLARLGLGEADLRCGMHPPSDGEVRRGLVEAGREPTALHNNCSGKHAGFLALALELGVPLERYLDPDSAGQVLVRESLAELADTPVAELEPATDGCSAPTYRVSLRGLGTAIARVSSPDGLAPARRRACLSIREAVRAHPVLLAGSRRRLDTDLVRATDGRLFPKIGAEAVYVVGVRDGGRGLAVKVDDGGTRGLTALVMGLLERLELVGAGELAALSAWTEPTLKNHAGLEVGRVEPILS